MFSKNRLTALVCVVAVTLLIFGCATTGGSNRNASSSESSDIDQLLGIGDASTDKEINEDDVLKLLGVSDDASSSEQTLATTENAESQVDVQNAAESNQTSRLPQDQSAASRMDRATPSFKADAYYERYQEALQVYRNKNYRDAIQKFEALLSTDSRHGLSDNCQYWIGESYYDLQNYQQAIVSFEKVFTYPKSNKDDSAQLKLAMCYLRLNEKVKAKEEFQKLVRDYPTSEYVTIAKRFITQLDVNTSTP